MAIATGLASVSNAIGVAIGYILPPIYIQSPGVVDMSGLLLMEAVLVTIVGLGIVLAFCEKPASPPSATANGLTMIGGFVVNLRRLVSEPHWWLILVQQALSQGTFNTMATIIALLVNPFGYNADFVV